MKNDLIDAIHKQIFNHQSNATYKVQGIQPLFTASLYSKIVIIGQAPGIRAQTSGIPWDDASGLRLMNWLGVSEKQFRDTSNFALIPMDFYYPGKGKSGDLPPRKDFAPLWHKQIMDLMSEIKLIVLIGQYSQKYYLKNNNYKTLTKTVQNFNEFLPEYFPLVHPSPLNFRWNKKNDWFENEVLPVLKNIVKEILSISK